MLGWALTFLVVALIAAVATPGVGWCVRATGTSRSPRANQTSNDGWLGRVFAISDPATVGGAPSETTPPESRAARTIPKEAPK